MELVKVKFKGDYAYIEKSKVGKTRKDVGLTGVWELYEEESKKEVEVKKTPARTKPKKAGR